MNFPRLTYGRLALTFSRGLAINSFFFLLASLSSSQQSSLTHLSPAGDPREIVWRSVELDTRMFELAHNYTCQQREVRKHLGPKGEVKFIKIETWDITNLYGEPYPRLIQRDDKPLSAKDEKEEKEKLDKFFAKRKNESEENRQKRQAKEKKEREEERAFVHEIVNAYDFRIVGEEAVEGREAWVIEATPRQDFHPTEPHAGMLSNSLGFFIARIHKGSHFSFEQSRLNDEVWLMRRFHVDVNARVLLLTSRSVELDDTFSNYKKFATNTRILPGLQEVEPK
jgi:hypothetical protein